MWKSTIFEWPAVLLVPPHCAHPVRGNDGPSLWSWCVQGLHCATQCRSVEAGRFQRSSTSSRGIRERAKHTQLEAADRHSQQEKWERRWRNDTAVIQRPTQSSSGLYIVMWNGAGLAFRLGELYGCLAKEMFGTFNASGLCISVRGSPRCQIRFPSNCRTRNFKLPHKEIFSFLSFVFAGDRSVRHSTRVRARVVPPAAARHIPGPGGRRRRNRRLDPQRHWQSQTQGERSMSLSSRRVQFLCQTKILTTSHIRLFWSFFFRLLCVWSF